MPSNNLTRVVGTYHFGEKGVPRTVHPFAAGTQSGGSATLRQRQAHLTVFWPRQKSGDVLSEGTCLLEQGASSSKKYPSGDSTSC